MLNQSEPNVILTAYATKVNRPEPNWTEPQTCLVGRNHALIVQLLHLTELNYCIITLQTIYYFKM